MFFRILCFRVCLPQLVLIGLAVSCRSDAAMPNCIGAWSFDEGKGSTAKDSLFGNDGILKNGPLKTFGPTWEVGKVGTALYFDGEDQHVQIPGLSEFLGKTASLSFWIKTDQRGKGPYLEAPGIAGVELTGGSNDVFWGWLDTNGNIGVCAGDLPGAQSKKPVNDNQWHHVVLTRDTATGDTQVYVDGELNGELTSEKGEKTTTFYSLGRIENPRTTEHKYFKGLLDEVRLFSRVITADEVKQLYKGDE